MSYRETAIVLVLCPIEPTYVILCVYSYLFSRPPPPSYVPRQQPIKEEVIFDPKVHKRRSEFHGLGLAGRVLRFKFRPVSEKALDRLDKLYQHR